MRMSADACAVRVCRPCDWWRLVVVTYCAMLYFDQKLYVMIIIFKVFIAIVMLYVVALASYVLYVYLRDVIESRVNKSYRKRVRNEVSTFIIDYINNEYSPFIEVGTPDHLISELQLEPEDIENIFRAVAGENNTSLDSSQFFNEFGADPTVANLISYISSHTS